MTLRTDPADLTWPRHTTHATLRPLTLDDVDAMLAYRQDPEVVAHLSHDVLDRRGVEERIRARLFDRIDDSGAVTRGAAVVVDGALVGDAMMRVAPSPDGAPALWIGYAFGRDAWGRGLATEVARALVEVGAELSLPVWADAYVENTASHRVLEKAGFTRWGRDARDGRALDVFRHVGGHPS